MAKRDLTLEDALDEICKFMMADPKNRIELSTIIQGDSEDLVMGSHHMRFVEKDGELLSYEVQFVIGTSTIKNIVMLPPCAKILIPLVIEEMQKRGLKF